MDGSKTQQSILPKAVGLKASVFGSRALWLPRVVWHLARLGWHILRDLCDYRWEVLYDEFLRWLPGDVGIAKRRAYFTPQFGRCGAGLVLCQGVLIQAIERACVGNHFGVAPGVMINAAGGFTAGNDVLIGPHTRIWTINHRFDDQTAPIRVQNWVEEPVVIGDDVWIGAQCVVLPGVTIGSHSVIGAGSIVTLDLPAWSIAVGNPAKVIRSRLAEEASSGVTARSKHRGQPQGADPGIRAKDDKDS